MKRGVRFKSLFKGGHQERGRRAGTENAPGIVGLGLAADLAMKNMAQDAAQMARLRDRLEKGILQRIGSCFVTGDPQNRLPNTANIAFEYIEGEAILLLLNKEGNSSVLRLRLYVGIPGAVACDARHEHSLHSCAWGDPLLAVARNDGRGCRSRFSGHAGHHFQAP